MGMVHLNQMLYRIIRHVHVAQYQLYCEPNTEDEEDNYTVMSPAGQFVGCGKWGELTSKDTDKYKEYVKITA